MKMTRYFSLFLALVLVCAMAVAPVSAAEVTTVTVESINDVAYTAGQEVVLDVSVANNVGYTNFNFGIVYDHTQLELVEIVTTKDDGYQYIPQGIVMPNENTDQIVFANGTEIKVNGTFFKLKFKVLSSATSKAADVSLKVNEFYNVKSPVVSKFVPGGVKVVGSTTGSTSTPGSIPTPGGNIANVDADGNITITTPGGATLGGGNLSEPTSGNTQGGSTGGQGGNTPGNTPGGNTPGNTPGGNTPGQTPGGDEGDFPASGSVNNTTDKQSGDKKATYTFTQSGKLEVTYSQACMVIVEDEAGNLTVISATKVEGKENTYEFPVNTVSNIKTITIAAKGDFNGDGAASAFDLAQASKAMANEQEISELQKILMDFDGNGTVSAFDLANLSKGLANENLTW